MNEIDREYLDGLRQEALRYRRVLQEIARGRVDNGRPLGAETSRQLARTVLDTWPSRTAQPQQDHQT
jgi:hypothetical protein